MSFKLPFWSPAHAEAILFDWDGVIAETRLDFSEVRKKYYGDRDVMLLEDASSLAPAMQDALMSDLEALEVRGARTAGVVPGILDVLAWTEKNKIPWAVVSRNCRESILTAAEATSLKLPRIVRSRDDGQYVKPDPRALVDTCRELGANPAQTLFIGDYVYDMIGARRAGMRSVLVRKEIDGGWDSWLEYSCRSMAELYRELESPGEAVPWEYQESAAKHGGGFLRCAAEITALTPDDADIRLDVWLVRAASLGVASFCVPDVQFSPASWKLNPSFEPAFMGHSLADAIRSFLGTRFPLATVTTDKCEDAVMLPRNPDEIEDFLCRRMKQSG
jgi:HAD superfamily hydrolase (TIGR01509 family)